MKFAYIGKKRPGAPEICCEHEMVWDTQGLFSVVLLVVLGKWDGMGSLTALSRHGEGEKGGWPRNL